MLNRKMQFEIDTHEFADTEDSSQRKDQNLQEN
jgi:hypothetical protein